MTRLTVNGSTKLYGIIGNPVKHSFSPAMQTQAFQAMDINAVYLPFFIQESELPGILNAFQITRLQGFNVTVPFKEKIIPYLSEISREAELLQSVNTVIRTATGWKGYSTDGIGFVKAATNAGFQISDKNILLIGAGGSAKAIALSLVKHHISSLTIINRTLSKAESLAGIIASENSDIEITVNPSVHKKYDLLINSTSVGMDGKKCPVDDVMINYCRAVIDIIYNPSQTPLLQKAVQKGIPCDNGIGMLLYQGTESFEIWTGKKAPVNVMKDCLEKSLNSV